MTDQGIQAHGQWTQPVRGSETSSGVVTLVPRMGDTSCVLPGPVGPPSILEGWRIAVPHHRQLEDTALERQPMAQHASVSHSLRTVPVLRLDPPEQWLART